MPVFFKESLDRDILLPGFTLPFGVPQWPPYLCFITRYSTFWHCLRKTMNPAATTSLFAAILKQGQGQLLPPLDRTRLGECYFLLYTSATDCLFLSYYFLFPFSLRNAVNIVQPIFLQSWKFHLNGVVSTRTRTHTHCDKHSYSAWYTFAWKHLNLHMSTNVLKHTTKPKHQL